MYGEDEDFYIVMSAFYQQMIEGKQRLKYIAQSYDTACEKARQEKKGNNFSARKSYVYRQLEKLVDAGLLEKSRDYSQQNRPRRYEANFDPDLFHDIIEDRLKRCQIWDRLVDEDGPTLAEKEAKQEFEKTMENLGVDVESE